MPGLIATAAKTVLVPAVARKLEYAVVKSTECVDLTRPINRNAHAQLGVAAGAADRGWNTAYNFAVRINDYQDSLYKLAPIAAAVTEQGAATQEIARGVEVAADRTVATAKEVNLMGAATHDTRSSAAAVKMVADDLSSVAGRIRTQVDQFFDRLSA